MDRKKTKERDWASLPDGVLNLIAKNLNEIFDFVRFRAVCTSWFSSTPITDCPPQFPWILEGSMDEPDLRFYSIPFNKLFTIHAPKFMNSYISGLIEGYMPVLQNSQLFLLNPLSNHEIPLPSHDFDATNEWFTHRINRMGKSAVFCGIYDSEPIFKVAFCNVGEEKWRVLTLNSDIDKCEFDYFYLDDMLFFVEDDSGATKVVDITTGALAYVVPPPKGYVGGGFVHIVETTGAILRFYQHSYESRIFSGNDWFDVDQLDLSEDGSPCWVKVNNIGNYAFFTDMRGGFVLKANGLARIKANSIYFLEEIYLDADRGPLYQLKRIDIETGATELLPFPFRNPAGWYVPILHHH